MSSCIIGFYRPDAVCITERKRVRQKERHRQRNKEKMPDRQAPAVNCLQTYLTKHIPTKSLLLLLLAYFEGIEIPRDPDECGDVIFIWFM